MFLKFGILLLAVYFCRTSALAPCVCARNYNPVCGSDNHTYANQCRFDCVQYTNRDLNLTVAHQGQCGGPTLQLCICDYQDKPVCGSDGVTYPHECGLGCQQRKDPAAHLTLQHEGPCANKTETPESKHFCECTEELNLVCGSDGITYANPCLLECIANQTGGLTKQHEGPCDRVKIAEVAALPTCTCAKNLQPVCGSDGVTYDNPCLLECAAQNKALTKQSDKACDDSNTVKVVEQAAPTNCVCTREDVPVCGSNGQTYANQCLLECAAKSDPDLTLLHADSC